MSLHQVDTFDKFLIFLGDSKKIIITVLIITIIILINVIIVNEIIYKIKTKIFINKVEKILKDMK